MYVRAAHVNVIRGDFLHWHIEVICNFTQLLPGALIMDERDANTHSAKPSGPSDAVEVCGVSTITMPLLVTIVGKS